MLTYPIAMMFWETVKRTQTHACVTAGALGPTSPTQGPGGLSLPGVSWSLWSPWGAQGWDPTLQKGGQSWDSIHHPRGQGTGDRCT